jgi:hypothetical protein
MDRWCVVQESQNVVVFRGGLGCVDRSFAPCSAQPRTILCYGPTVLLLFFDARVAQCNVIISTVVNYVRYVIIEGLARARSPSMKKANIKSVERWLKGRLFSTDPRWWMADYWLLTNHAASLSTSKLSPTTITQSASRARDSQSRARCCSSIQQSRYTCIDASLLSHCNIGNCLIRSKATRVKKDETLWWVRGALWQQQHQGIRPTSHKLPQESHAK